MRLLPFQRRFVRAVLDPKIRMAVMSTPRGQGKTTLSGLLAMRALTPGDPMFRPGTESHVIAASLMQGRRTIFRQLRSVLPAEGYRVADSQNHAYVEHLETSTKLSVLPANSKTSQGLVGCPWVLCDEPGSWKVQDGEAVFDALESAQGKPGSALKIVMVGTLAPAFGGWWPDLVAAGSRGHVHVTSLQGDLDRWSDLRHVFSVNPLMAKYAESRAVLRTERDAAVADERNKARFLSYRLNVPYRDETTVLLTVSDFEKLCARPVPPREGRPVVGIDMGAGRAWSAAVAVYGNGRTEARAIAPGIPDLSAQERRDRQPSGAYRKLFEKGLLGVAEGKRVPTARQLLDRTRDWRPGLMLCDRFRLPELQDAGPPCPLTMRAGRYSESSEDIRSLRRMAWDGGLSLEKSSRPLLAHSLSVSTVEPNDDGCLRLIKGVGNTSRDDVSAALVLAAGAADRLARRAGRRTWNYRRQL